jgi:protein-disulfide isomerase
VTKVKDIKTITNYGVLMTPALVVDGAVKVTGKLPKVEELKKWISE